MISACFTMWIASYAIVLWQNEGVNVCVYVKVREKENVEYDHVSLKSEKNIL